MPTVRITSDHVGSPQFQGQAVRAVGKLMRMDNDQVQLQLAGPEGGAPSWIPNRPSAHPRTTPAAGPFSPLATIPTSAVPTTVLTPDSMHKYHAEMVGKGCYEVIGTLQNGSITEMQTVYMGDNFGGRRVRSIHTRLPWMLPSHLDTPCPSPPALCCADRA